MKRGFPATFSVKVVLLALAMGAAVSAAALYIGYTTFSQWNLDFYQQMGYTLVRTVAGELTAEEIEGYYLTARLDERYSQIQNLLVDLQSNSPARQLYVGRPTDDGRFAFLFESSLGKELTQNGEPVSPIGVYMPLTGGFSEVKDKILNGEEIAPIYDRDKSVGWLLTVMIPVRRENGALAAYIAADFLMDGVVRAERTFLRNTAIVLAALTLAFLGIYLLVLRRGLLRPVKLLAAAAERCGRDGDAEAFAKLEIKGGEMRMLLEALREMQAASGQSSARRLEQALREQKRKEQLDLVNELNQAMLPRKLPERQGAIPFQVCGGIQQGQGLACCFYDDFQLGRDHLCVMIGETPGSGVHPVLYTVVGQTAIKNQMLSGLTLTEAMSAANRQLYEMNGNLYMDVLVGILDSVTGRFTFVNAGQRQPLLMRSQGRYEWVDASPYAPLGQSEHAAYRVTELELEQGDRLFFHTEGLEKNRNRGGGAFDKERLRRTLNERPVLLADLERQLQSVRDAVGGYAAQSGEPRGYALLGLEYRRRDRAQAHCILTAEGGAAVLQAFLEEQLRANRLDERQIAQIVVLGDELFSLCCRGAARDDRFLAEYVISEEEDLLFFRIKGPMRGRSPLDSPEEEPARRAVDFITQNTQRVFFEPGESADTVTLVRRIRLERAQG